MPRRPTSRGDTRSEFVRAAVRLVHGRGFAATTLADIAKAAKVPLGNVYYHFRSKDDLGRAVVAARAEQYRALRQAWDADPSPRARLGAFVQMTIDSREELAKSGCPIGTLCMELRSEGGPLAREAAALFAETLEWLERQFRALGQGTASADLAVQLLASLEGATLLAQSFGEPRYVLREAKRLQEWIGAMR